MDLETMFEWSTENVGGAASIALVTAIIGGIGAALVKGFVFYWQYRAAVIRFYNDVQIWLEDVRDIETGDDFRVRVGRVLQGRKSFKFNAPSSSKSDSTEIMKYIYLLKADEVRLVRSFIVYNDLLENIDSSLASDEFASFDRARKISALVEHQQTEFLTQSYGRLAVARLRQRHYLQLSPEVVWRMKQDREDVSNLTKSLYAEAMKNLSGDPSCRS